MSPPLARKCLAPGTTVAPGEVMVATGVGDPARGLLPCPAAPLVGGVLERRGVPIRYGPVPHYAEASQSDDGAVLFLTSALLAEGEATGIGAAANAVDGLAAAAARAAVEEWSAMVGTHRLLEGIGPWCEGAARALEQAQETLASAGGPVYVYGWLAANGQARDDLAASGAVFVSSLSEVPDGSTLLIPAHGVPPAVWDEAARRGLRTVDATCPLVAAVHAETVSTHVMIAKTTESAIHATKRGPSGAGTSSADPYGRRRSASSAYVCGRSAGAFASVRSTTAARPRGMSRRSTRGDAGFSEATFDTSSRRSGASSGGRPVRR